MTTIRTSLSGTPPAMPPDDFAQITIDAMLAEITRRSNLVRQSLEILPNPDSEFGQHHQRVLRAFRAAAEALMAPQGESR